MADNPNLPKSEKPTHEAAELPEGYRKKEPPPPDRVIDMGLDRCGAVSLKAIYIDKNWRAWIDPNAPVELHDYYAPLPHGHVLVIRRGDGFELVLNTPTIEKGLERSITHEHYDFFIPVLKIVHYNPRR